MDTNKALPLAGIRILEMGSLIAGPFAAKILGEFGAEVIKIEPPVTGDPLRKWRKMHQGTSLWWQVQSRNKKSVAVDLKSEKGRELVRKLACSCDIVIENFRPGTLEGWDLGWETLSALNPRLIMLRISGYGQTGPYRDLPGFGVIGEAMGGLRYVTGYPDRPPVRVGVSLGDSLSSLHGVMGAMFALYHRDVHGGKGQYIDVALYESVFNVMESLIPEQDFMGHTRERTGSSLPGIAPTNAYRCNDGNHVLVAGNGDGIFRRLMKSIERDDLANDPRFEHNDGRVAGVQEIDSAIEAWTSVRSQEEVLAVLSKAGVPAGKIYSAADIMSDPHYEAREMIHDIETKDGTRMKVPGVVPKLSGTPGRIREAAPALGEHTFAVLRDLGLTAGELDDLREQHVIA
ncbi:L-carnitine dehydratase/bile acid-inducible protein F [Caballeronia catudaia]|uniref:L-carnitine dehydratase/bile acid-inducible protein F n=1 Tax=Caballeronia catudaia TaxID=1777136 RepID=A0A158DPQ6_9BURK|nr:CaiB/BaiF CoA-transferase family protein [Caballeronia catudaia]SAK95737.1 L-carnitine dehydratase/bile acid-inducible protein F [Caballeronia catudaia]